MARHTSISEARRHPGRLSAAVCDRARRRGDEGFALLVVLWFLVLIATIGIYLSANSRTESAIAQNVRASAKAEALADGAVAQTVFIETDPAIDKRWPFDWAVHTLKLPTGLVTVRVRDESEKINPNLASDRLLTALFVALGVDPDKAARLGPAIADWVDQDDNPRPLGAEKDDYADAGKDYQPRNGPMLSLNELGLVLGMTPEILASARPYLTISTAVARPDGVNAPPVVKQALTMTRDEAASANANANAAAGAGATANGSGTADGGVAGTGTSAPAPTSPADMAVPGDVAQQEAQNGNGAQPGTGTPAGPILEIEATAHGSDGAVYVRSAIVRVDSSVPRGYTVLDWHRGDLTE